MFALLAAALPGAFGGTTSGGRTVLAAAPVEMIGCESGTLGCDAVAPILAEGDDVGGDSYAVEPVVKGRPDHSAAGFRRVQAASLRARVALPLDRPPRKS